MTDKELHEAVEQMLLRSPLVAGRRGTPENQAKGLAKRIIALVRTA